MRKSFYLLWSFFRASLISDLEYRLNIVVKVITDIIWYVVQLSVFEVLFHHLPRISEWSIESTRVFMGVLFIVDATWMFLLSENLEGLPWKVKAGDLDLVLVKPVSSQFMLSFQKMATAYLINILITIGYLGWALNHVPGGIQPWRVLYLFLAIPLAVSIVYSFRIMFASLSIIFVNAESVNFVWYQLYKMGTRPDSVYPSWLRISLLTFLPVGFIASVPARLVLGYEEVWMIVVFPIVSFILFDLSRRFWNFSLRFYSSASS